MQVFCDFDGTISTLDTVDAILGQFADTQWEAIEDEWKQGIIGSGECMRRQIALLRGTRHQLSDALDAIDIDPDFPAFVAYCTDAGIPVTVISDGVDYFIQHVLTRHGITLPVIANHLAISGSGEQTRYQLFSPFANEACSSGVCKCSAVGARSGMRVYVGDGRSDFCVSNKPELVFAKGKLADHCAREGTPYITYQQFGDVIQALQRNVPSRHLTLASSPSLAFA